MWPCIWNMLVSNLCCVTRKKREVQTNRLYFWFIYRYIVELSCSTAALSWLCPNYCPLDFSEGRWQHFDSHHCISPGWSHWFDYHCHGDQGCGHSFPKERQWEEVSEHMHMDTCTWTHVHTPTLLMQRQIIRTMAPGHEHLTPLQIFHIACTSFPLAQSLTAPMPSYTHHHIQGLNNWTWVFEDQYCLEY